ncbi:hypothetical protein ACIBL3_14075 [Kribbella sp. NPDC050124]|uniref:hypothetical protein n=1 Tax=Kribbella sp. NPDC050124 TaxID=3364114 RepID=UPI00379F6F28
MSTLSTGFVDGRLYRACSFVYHLMVVEGCLVIALLPTFATVLPLAPDPRNAPLFAVALIPAGPAVVAGLYAVCRKDGSPARDFVRGYRSSWREVLKVWVPAVVLIATTPALVAAVVAVWLANAVVITSRFSFRGRDTARLAAYYLGARWRCTLNVLVLGAAFTVLVALTSDWVAVLLLSPALYLLARVTRPLVADVEKRFV